MSREAVLTVSYTWRAWFQVVFLESFVQLEVGRNARDLDRLLYVLGNMWRGKHQHFLYVLRESCEGVHHRGCFEPETSKHLPCYLEETDLFVARD